MGVNSALPSGNNYLQLSIYAGVYNRAVIDIMVAIVTKYDDSGYYCTQVDTIVLIKVDNNLDKVDK